MDAATFDTLARQSMTPPGRAGEAYRVNLLAAKGLGQVEAALAGKGLGRELSGAIAGLLKRHALQGAATKVGEDHYAFIAGSDVAVDDVTAEVAALVRKTAPADAAAIEIGGTDFQLSAQPGSEKDVMQALRYTLNQVAEGKIDLSSRDFTAKSPTLLSDTITRMNALRSAITGHRFRMAYQPIVRLSDAALHHYEALMRFTDQASPASAVLFAEGVGLATELDLAVAADVLAAVSQARLQGRNPSVAINISGSSLLTPGFAPKLSELLRSYRLNAGTILLEITESSRISDLAAARELIDQFRADGHPVCLDDFGAGSSDLQYLRNLAVDYVKIDGIYVRDLRKERRHLSFVKAIIQLCRDLQIHTVAEMIEDETTARVLGDLGVGYGQGYLFGKPVIGLPTK